MNINNKNLKILLSSFIGESIDTKIQCPFAVKEIYWEELLIELNHSNKSIDIHFKYIEEYTKEGLRYVFDEEYGRYDVIDSDVEIIEFCLSSKTDKSRENLQRIQDETHVDKNALYTIISILEEI